jgi:hypothetical protein
LSFAVKKFAFKKATFLLNQQGLGQIAFLEMLNCRSFHQLGIPEN